jgi:hypothetical protein
MTTNPTGFIGPRQASRERQPYEAGTRSSAVILCGTNSTLRKLSRCHREEGPTAGSFSDVAVRIRRRSCRVAGRKASELVKGMVPWRKARFECPPLFSCPLDGNVRQGRVIPRMTPGRSRQICPSPEGGSSGGVGAAGRPQSPRLNSHVSPCIAPFEWIGFTSTPPSPTHDTVGPPPGHWRVSKDEPCLRRVAKSLRQGVGPDR